MADFNNLPGTFVDIQDGNLAIVEANPAPVVAVLGTAERGDTGVLTPVVRPADAVNAFGSSGTLIRGMYEAAFGGSTNTVLFRVAAKPAKVLHIGDSTGADGITLETVDKDNTAGNDLYVVWDDSDKHLWVYDEDDTLVFEVLNDEILTDTGRVYGYGSAASTTGVDIGTAPPTDHNDGVLMSLVSVTGTEYVVPTDGVDATAMELYEAMALAYAELEAFDADFMIPMDVYMDTPNLADDSTLVQQATPYTEGAEYVATGGETSFTLHKRVIESSIDLQVDPGGAGTWGPLSFTFSEGTGTNDEDEVTFTALGAGDEVRLSYYYLTDDGLLYYRTWEQDGETLFEWHHEKYRAEWSGSAWTTYEYHEANFAWQLANYCFNLTKNDNDCIGVIGVRPFRSTALKDLSDWTGFLPEKDSSGLVTTNGEGLAGNKWMAGKLVVAHDYQFQSEDLSAQIGAGRGAIGLEIGLSEMNAIPSTVVILVDGSPADVATVVSNAVTLHNPLAGTETTLVAYYYWDEDPVTTGQFGPGFYATAEDVEDGTPLSPLTDIGRYISVVMSWPLLFTPVDPTGFGYLATGAPIYGGFISGLPASSAPTNKVIPDIQMPFRMSKTKMDDLVSVHYVLFTPRERGTVVVDAPTAATSDSDYQRLTTIRIVAEVIRRLREALSPFIGEGLNSPQLQAMQTTADRVCTDAIKDGLIQRFEASVSASAIERVQGKANLDLLLVPSFELRQIFVTISLSAI